MTVRLWRLVSPAMSRSHAIPQKTHIENTVTVTNTKFLRIKIYDNWQADCHFAVSFGRCFGRDWIHVCAMRPDLYHESFRADGITTYLNLLHGAPGYARSMHGAYSRSGRYDRVWAKRTCLPGSAWTVRISCVLWENSRSRGVRIEVFQDPSLCNGPDEWTGVDIARTNDPNRDMRRLMIHDSRKEAEYNLVIDGIPVKFSRAHVGTKLGDYGHLTDSKGFHYEGNIFTDLKSVASEMDIIPRQHDIPINSDTVDLISKYKNWLTMYNPLVLSLPGNSHFSSRLASLSVGFTSSQASYNATVSLKSAAFGSQAQIDCPDRTLTAPAYLCASLKSHLFGMDITTASRSVAMSSKPRREVYVGEVELAVL